MTYIGIDERNRISRYFNCPVSDTTGLIEIEDNIITEWPFTVNGVPTWKYENNAAVRRTAAEIADDESRIIPVPSQMDRIEAQVLYTAILTDTLIEE